MSTKIFELDETNRKILRILQKKGEKTKIEELKNETGKTATAIRKRIEKLEENLDLKYIAIVDCHKLGYKEMLLASLRLSGPMQEIKKIINNMEEIKYAYVTSGEYPLFVMAKCLDHEDSLQIVEKLRKLPGVEEVKTEIVMDCIKEDHSLHV